MVALSEEVPELVMTTRVYERATLRRRMVSRPMQVSVPVRRERADVDGPDQQI